MLTPFDIEQLRGAAESVMADRATIFAPPDPNSPQPDSEGNLDTLFPSAWTEITANAICNVRLSRFRGQEKRSFDIPVGTSFNDIEFKYDQDIKKAYRIKITASANQPSLVGILFDVVDDAMDSAGIKRIVPVERKDING